jgi:phage antirepressor YoqD-like protein
MNLDLLKKDFLAKYIAIGESRFYKFLLAFGIARLVEIENKTYSGISPDLDLLKYYDGFIILFRREGNPEYIKIAKLFRKAAHKINRIMLEKNMTTKSTKFLTLV